MRVSKRLALASCLVAFLVASPGYTQILIEDSESTGRGESVYSDAFSYSPESYTSSQSLRADRRVGLGLAAAGKLGLGGLAIELNFTPIHSIEVAFGGGDPFQSFAFNWKYSAGGTYFSPYFSMGFARWYNSETVDGGIDSSTPSFLSSQLLSKSEIESGQFGLNFLTPAAGVQYHQLSGDYRGASVYVELVLLTDLRGLEPVPTGTVGGYFYF